VPEFVGTNSMKRTPEQRTRLIDFVGREYGTGRSLRELAELTGRTQSAIRRALDLAGVSRRGRGAPTVPPAR
jgi:predicted transcriptional regulator